VRIAFLRRNGRTWIGKNGDAVGPVKKDIEEYTDGGRCVAYVQ